MERSGQQLEAALSRLAELPLADEFGFSAGRSAILLSALNRTERKSAAATSRSDYPVKVVFAGA